MAACARGAAGATGTRLEIIAGAGCSPPMKPNLPLADTYRRQLQVLELPETDHAPTKSIGSSDITHISRVVPTIHPNFPIGENLPLHTRAFSEATTTTRGDDGLLEGARAMASIGQQHIFNFCITLSLDQRLKKASRLPVRDNLIARAVHN